MVIKILVYSFVHIYISHLAFGKRSSGTKTRQRKRIIAPQLQRNSTCSLAFNKNKGKKNMEMEVWAKKLEWLRWSWVFCTVKLKLPATLKHGCILFATTRWTATASDTGSDVTASLSAQSSNELPERGNTWKHEECESKKAYFSSCSGWGNKNDSLYRKHRRTGVDERRTKVSHMGIITAIPKTGHTCSILMSWILIDGRSIPDWVETRLTMKYCSFPVL